MPAAVAVIALALDLLVALGRSRSGLAPPAPGIDGALVDESPGLLTAASFTLYVVMPPAPTRWRPSRTAADKERPPDVHASRPLDGERPQLPLPGSSVPGYLGQSAGECDTGGTVASTAAIEAVTATQATAATPRYFHRGR
jgi:hypothetical protein